MTTLTEQDVIQTCEIHGFPLDLDQLEVVTAVVNQVLLAPSAAPAQPVRNCQTGWADFCLMAKHDGVTCPDDSCDSDDGIRSAPPAQTAVTVAMEGMTMPPDMGVCIQCRKISHYNGLSWGMCLECRRASEDQS